MLKIKDKYFKTLITHQQIVERATEIANQINTIYKDDTPLILGILNGAYRFVGELSNHIEIPCEITFARLKSYNEMERSNEVKELIALPEHLKGRKVIVVEDIVDTGNTLNKILNNLKEKEVASIAICTLLFKPAAFQFDFELKFVGFEIENDFVVGYGLDFDGAGRFWNNICKLEKV